MGRQLLLVLSDTHGGSDVGLCNPATKLWEKYDKSLQYPNLSKTQRLLWEAFNRHIGTARDIADGDPVIVAHLGDMTHGGVFLDDVIEPRFTGQYQIAKWNMYAITDNIPNIRAILIVSGTNVHTFDGSVEYVLADYLRLKMGFDVSCYPHTVLRIGSTTHDLAHHGPAPGKRVWTKQSTASSWLKSMMIREIMGGKEPSTVTYRGHFHEWVPTITHREYAVADDGWHQYESHFQFVPGYSGLSDHARKATKSESMVTWGMVMVEIIDNKSLTFYPLIDVRDTRVREEITFDGR